MRADHIAWMDGIEARTENKPPPHELAAERAKELKRFDGDPREVVDEHTRTRSMFDYKNDPLEVEAKGYVADKLSSIRQGKMVAQHEGRPVVVSLETGAGLKPFEHTANLFTWRSRAAIEANIRVQSAAAPAQSAQDGARPPASATRPASNSEADAARRAVEEARAELNKARNAFRKLARDLEVALKLDAGSVTPESMGSEEIGDQLRTRPKLYRELLRQCSGDTMPNSAAFH
jgi:hypothetical protein